MLLDNKKTGKVGDKLKESISKKSRLSIISGLLSIYAYDALKKELAKIESVRFLFSEPALSIDETLSPVFQGLCGDRFERWLRNKLTQTHIAKECASWLSRKADIRAVNMPHTLNQNLFHIENNNSAVAIQGSSSFTTSGLGYSDSNSYAMNMCLTDPESTRGLLEWFETIWSNKSAVSDIKNLLLEQLEAISRDRSGRFVYFLVLYNIFKDYLGELDEEQIIKTKTGFKDTQVWNKLYKFQRDGVLGAIDKLEKYNGCIIADSVGLGI